jgi:hypothetical protein
MWVDEYFTGCLELFAAAVFVLVQEVWLLWRFWHHRLIKCQLLCPSIHGAISHEAWIFRRCLDWPLSASRYGWHRLTTEQLTHLQICVSKLLWPWDLKLSLQYFTFCWPYISIYVCNETNLMHYLSSVYSVTIPLHVLGLLVAHHQEVAMYICYSWYVLYVLVDCRQAWLEWNYIQLVSLHTYLNRNVAKDSVLWHVTLCCWLSGVMLNGYSGTGTTISMYLMLSPMLTNLGLFDREDECTMGLQSVRNLLPYGMWQGTGPGSYFWTPYFYGSFHTVHHTVCYTVHHTVHHTQRADDINPLTPNNL